MSGGSSYSPKEIAQSFVKQYYDMLARNPSELYRFYSEDSSFCHTSHAHENAQVVKGVEFIREHIAKLELLNATVDLTEGAYDVQDSFSNVDGILVVVTGHFSLKDIAHRPFTHTFILAKPPGAAGGAYYVHNSVFRLQSARSKAVLAATGASAAGSPVAKPAGAIVVHEHKSKDSKKNKDLKDKATEAAAADKFADKIANAGAGEKDTAAGEAEEPKTEAADSNKEKRPSAAAVADNSSKTENTAGTDSGKKEKSQGGQQVQTKEKDSNDNSEKENPSNKKGDEGAGAKTAVAVKDTEPESKGPMSFASMAKRLAATASDAGGKVTLPPAPRAKPVAAAASVKPESSGSKEATGNSKIGGTGTKTERKNSEHGNGAPNGNTHNSLYIKQINAKCDDEGLRTIFGVFGDITRVDLNVSKSFAFVDFATREGLLGVLSQKEPFRLGGATLRVEERAPKKKDPGSTHSNGGKDGNKSNKKTGENRNSGGSKSPGNNGSSNNLGGKKTVRAGDRGLKNNSSNSK